MTKIIIKVFLFFIGLVCIMYPLVTKYITFRNQTISIFNYEAELKIMEQTELDNKIKNAEEINKEKITETIVVNPNDIDNKIEVNSNSSFFKFGDMIGYVEIPKINVNLPIYEGVNTDNLSKGVAHIEETSLPTGEKNTNCVLAGHTGIFNAIIFDNIDMLEIDDDFYIIFLNQKNKYKIIDKREVFQNEVENIKIEENRCLVTLVTCVLRLDNRQRLLVIGEKVEEEKDIEDEGINNEEQLTTTKLTNISELNILKNFVKNNKEFIITILSIILIIIIFEVISNRKK